VKFTFRLFFLSPQHAQGLFSIKKTTASAMGFVVARPRISSADSPRGGVVTKPNGLRSFRLFLLKQDHKQVWGLFQKKNPSLPQWVLL